MAYTISLQLGDKTTEGVGDTMLEALQTLPRPAKIMAKAILTVSNGETSRQMLLTPVKVKQLFYTSAGIAAIKAKQLETSLK